MSDDTTITGDPTRLGPDSPDGEWLVIRREGAPEGAVRCDHATLHECTPDGITSWGGGHVLYTDADAETRGRVRGTWDSAKHHGYRDRGWWYRNGVTFETVDAGDLPVF